MKLVIKLMMKILKNVNDEQNYNCEDCIYNMKKEGVYGDHDISDYE